MITSRIKVGHPARVFRYNGADEKRMQVQFARPCVLYIDLELEFAAANEDAIPLLDKSGRDKPAVLLRAANARHAVGAARRHRGAGNERDVPGAQGGVS